MRKGITLITNNPCFQRTIDSLRLMFLNGTSLDVLVAARDAVHFGNDLLTHPLYGNLRPSQQPFRSVLLQNTAQKRQAKIFAAANYLESVLKIEEAVFLYRSYGGCLAVPANLPDAVRGDYAFVDSELMRESLTLYGLLPY